MVHRLLHITSFVETSALFRELREVILKPGRVNHNNREAGIIGFDDDVCRDHFACGAKGLQYWKWLQGNITSKDLVDKTGGKAIYDQSYITDTTYIDDTQAPSIRHDLLNHHLPDLRDPAYTYWFTSSRNPATGIETEEAAYKNIFNTADGVLIALYNFRDEDDAKTLPWSEIMYQVWQQSRAHDNERHAKSGLRPGASLSTLQHSIQATVTNDQTLEILEEMYTRMRYPPIRQGDTKWREWTKEATPHWFFALLGTDNCKGTVFLLIQHGVEAGRKEIPEIWTRWDKFYPDIWMVIRRAKIIENIRFPDDPQYDRVAIN
ncbi:MAG: hypothetical protein Q9185_004680 [Variospora sp. 1 TL-2023]